MRDKNIIKKSNNKIKNRDKAVSSGLQVLKSACYTGVSIETDLINQLLIEEFVLAERDVRTIISCYKEKRNTFETGN